MSDSSAPMLEVIQRGLSNNGFTLDPAIFVPVERFDLSDALPKDRDEKLKRILENLHNHHNAVRRNMIRLVAVQKEKLLANARELLKLEEQNKQIFDTTADNRGPSDDDQQEFDEVMRNLTHRKTIGSRGREYEFRELDFSKVSLEAPEGAADAGGDTTMGGMGNMEAKTSITVQQELNIALQELALRAASEMEAYDKHAESTKDYYRRALQRNAARMGSDKDAMITTGGNPAAADTASSRERGILSNKNDLADIDMDVLARPILEQQQQTSILPNNVIDASKDPRRKSVDATEDAIRRSEAIRGSVVTSKDSRRKSVDFTRNTKPGPNSPAKDARRGSSDMPTNIWKGRW